MAAHSDVIKPDAFDGTCFKRWQIKTRMWLTDLKLFWVVTSVLPETALADADATMKAIADAEKAKDIWDELESKFSEVDNGNESFTTENFLNYKMYEGRSVMEQLQELQLIVKDLVQYNCILPDNFLVNAILAKLSSSWRDFVTTRYYMKKQMTLSKLSAAINAEERARASNKPSPQVQAHLVEKGSSSRFQNQKQKKYNAQPP
ncbi:uncharacterized protein LOC133914915 [Phragmites australis]|uniref:uncharacterized protein LOC133914915 n=1 Tax=Phragmites australis TaxID=29695 RepID=UPI002D799949|nr:uncharacterized protein LOC133914915 [Phragmites australis]